jgi:hypothetical protein
MFDHMKRKNVSRLAAPLCVLLCLLASCAGTPRAKRPDPVFLTNKARFDLLPPADMDGSVDMPQRIDGAYGDRSFSFLVYVKADTGGIDFLVLNDLGSEMARLVYDASGLSSSGPAIASGLPAAYVIADFQLSYYRVDALARSLAPVRLEVVETVSGDLTVREIISPEGVVAHIEKRADGLRYENRLRGYAYDIAYGGADE